MTEMTVTYYLTDTQLDRLQRLVSIYNDAIASTGRQTSPEELFESIMHMGTGSINDRLQSWENYLERNQQRNKSHGGKNCTPHSER